MWYFAVVVLVIGAHNILFPRPQTFPAIFPASATLIEHEKRRKQRTGGRGTLRGRRAAALDVAGGSIGAFGLLTFARLAWKLMPDLSPWATLSIATLGCINARLETLAHLLVDSYLLVVDSYLVDSYLCFSGRLNCTHFESFYGCLRSRM